MTTPPRPASGKQTALAQPDRVAALLRQRITDGVLRPGTHLSEATLSEELGVSRNTLREGFRIMAQEGLLRHEANRGVFVARPDVQAILEIYRTRRLIQCAALAQGYPGHPGAAKMRAAVDQAAEGVAAGDWLDVGSADIAFHAAIVDLADSPRLSAFFAQLLMELRLVFGLLPEPERLHAPFLDRNRTILDLLEQGEPARAATVLDTYLTQSERLILSAYPAPEA